METPRHTGPVPATGTPLTDQHGQTDQSAQPVPSTGPHEPVVRTVVTDAEPVERTVSVQTGEPTPPVVRTVVTESDAPVRRVDDARRPDRRAWWIGGGTLGAGALASAVTAVIRRVRRPEPEPTPVERLAQPQVYGPAIAALAATAGTAVGVRQAARKVQAAREERRERREAETLDDLALVDAAPAMAATAPVAPRSRVALGAGGDVQDAYVPLDQGTDDYDDALDAALLLDDEGVDVEDGDDELETAPIPAEARRLLETLLDPTMAEGADLPGAAVLRDQLPYVRTTPDALPAAVEEIDWLPLVVESPMVLDRAVPHDFTWPVRARFVDHGQPFQLTLIVIDGELGALSVSPDDEGGHVEWDEIPSARTWPEVDDLTFEVDGTRR